MTDLSGARSVRAARAGRCGRRSPLCSRENHARLPVAGVVASRLCCLRLCSDGAAVSQVQSAGHRASRHDRKHGGHQESEAKVVLAMMRMVMSHDDSPFGMTQQKATSSRDLASEPTGSPTSDVPVREHPWDVVSRCTWPGH